MPAKLASSRTKKNKGLDTRLRGYDRCVDPRQAISGLTKGELNG